MRQGITAVTPGESGEVELGGDVEPFPEAGRIGVTSDTHGLLRPELFDLFAEVDLILHAGDVVLEEHLLDLQVLAPVRAVYGNVDGAELRRKIPAVRVIDARGVRIAMAHGDRGLNARSLMEKVPGADVVIQGHTHLPRRERRGGVLVLNPGSAGPRRPGKPVTAAILDVGDGEARAQHLQLTD